MNENLDLTKILANVPQGTPLYSPIFGNVTFGGINDDDDFPIYVEFDGDENSFASNGTYYNYKDSECLLFPSKDQRDWSKFKTEPQKERVTLHPFDRVLVRDNGDKVWQASLFSNKVHDRRFRCITYFWAECIPYNEETAHLVDTTDKPEKEYEIIFDKSFKK